MKKGGAAWLRAVCWDDVGVVWPSPSSACQSQGQGCYAARRVTVVAVAARFEVSTFLGSHVSAASPAAGSSSLMGGVWKTDSGLKQRPAGATSGVPRGVFRWELAPE